MSATVDMKKLGQMLEKFGNTILRQEKCVEVIVLFLE